MFAAAKNLGDGAGGMGDLLTRLRAREKARHGLQAKKDVDSSGLPIMTAAAIRQVAIDDEGYETPELNDRLYLHFKGYRKIQNLEPYTNLKALWLGGNGLSEIQGISHLSQLRCLYLERNLISTIKGLDGLENLVQLDLSQNCIETTLGLRCLPALHTLNLSKNALQDADSVSPLTECSSLTNLDVTANKLAGPGVLDVLSSLKRLVSLSLSGNPILAETAHFRKTVITASPKLRYLDRPVFQAERVAAAAWTVGGAEAEREARTRYQEEKRNEDRRQMQVFRDWQAEMRQKKQAEIEARAAAGLGPPEASPEEVRRDEERAAKAKADAEEDRRLINEVGLCKIADAFYASEGKGESRRSTMETLAGGNLLAGAKDSQEPTGSNDPAGRGSGDVDGEEDEETKQVFPAVSGQPLPEACGALVNEEATGGSNNRVGLSARESGASVAGSSSARTNEPNKGDSSTTAAAVGAALKEAASSSHSETAGENDAKSTDRSLPNTPTSANASTECRGSSGSSSNSDDLAASAVAFSELAPTSTGRGNGGNGGNGGSGGSNGSGGSEHEHKEGGADDDDDDDDDGNGNGSDASSEQEHEREEKGGERDEGKEENGRDEGQSQPQREAEEDEERVRRVRVAQSLAMYRAQLAAERRLEEANALGVEEQKMGAGVDGEGMMSVSGSPPRRGSRASAGRFQRRLEEASAEVATESAAAPRIATAAAVGEAQTREACLYSGGGAAAGGLLGGESRGTTRKTWGEHDQLETGDPGDDGPLKQWTPREDGRLKRLVRECVFDFDLVAARFSSAGDADYGGDGAPRAATAEDCRVRFAQLDRAEDSADDEREASQGDTRDCCDSGVVYGVAAPGVLENAGLSFAELEHKAKNMKSRFLEPPKELPSTKDDDNDDVEDVGDGDKDTGSHDMFAGAADSGGHAPGGAKDGVVVGGFTGSTGRLSVRSAGVGAVGANEPELIVVSSAADAATTCEGNGGRGGGRGVRGGSESDSDGEDDEVLTRAQIKNMVAQKAQQYEAKN